ncbi:Crp/Fnr family transcriptional regulator [Actinacidiphila oryziradicis]|jgi:CRP-like cAMP-binding protein|uniref:Crp/Fnr family transcriptional regulator n=1 Tax=Actinacidiphila oryziradicis TaxID=2571141 RepID=A0A4U0RI31_9ACTN|nr:Crp/Fnr family transcriptional regulator [Actinacidiphila oryziradicis]TJZ95165.1 Crp/Fnr family transcriptional regulator [Actinacidiphila oryziradicis]
MTAEDRLPPGLSGPPEPFGPEELVVLRAAGRVRAWERGEVLIRQGGHPDSVILITDGLTKVTSDSDNGYTSLLALRGPGELVGELSCLDGSPRSATVTAMVRVDGVVVAAATFRRLLGEHEKLSASVLCSVVARLRDSDILRAGHGAHTARVRVARVLVELARRYGVAEQTPPGAISVHMNQQELAGASATSRESVVRCLRTMQDEGLVETYRGRTVVLDLARLRELAET